MFWFLRNSLLRSYQSLTSKLRGSEEINQTISVTVAGIIWQISEKWDLKILPIEEAKVFVKSR